MILESAISVTGLGWPWVQGRREVVHRSGELQVFGCVWRKGAKCTIDHSILSTLVSCYEATRPLTDSHARTPTHTYWYRRETIILPSLKSQILKNIIVFVSNTPSSNDIVSTLGDIMATLFVYSLNICACVLYVLGIFPSAAGVGECRVDSYLYVFLYSVRFLYPCWFKGCYNPWCYFCICSIIGSS